VEQLKRDKLILIGAMKGAGVKINSFTSFVAVW